MGINKRYFVIPIPEAMSLANERKLEEWFEELGLEADEYDEEDLFCCCTKGEENEDETKIT